MYHDVYTDQLRLGADHWMHAACAASGFSSELRLLQDSEVCDLQLNPVWYRGLRLAAHIHSGLGGG